MQLAAIDTPTEDWDGVSVLEQRAAPRFFALIRSAKLITAQGEFVCVVRDVSVTGVRLRCFHALPKGSAMALELQNGDLFELEFVRQEGLEASFRFVTPATIERLMQVAEPFPRRPLRLSLSIPLTLRTPAGPVAAVTRNMSQQGCRIETAFPLALAQPVIIDGRHLPGIRAKVRWRRDGDCGLVFDDTFSLRDFAIHAARLQCPALVAG